MFLDSKLDFKKNIPYKINKVSKTKELLRRLQILLPKLPLITIYKSFIWPHLDYEDIIYDKAYKVSFHQSLEFIQYLTAVVITGSTRETSREKIYPKLGFESCGGRRWYKKLL